jgi:hypothetical protein
MEGEAEAKGVSLSMLLKEIIEEHYGIKLGKPPAKPFIVERAQWGAVDLFEKALKELKERRALNKKKRSQTLKIISPRPEQAILLKKKP